MILYNSDKEIKLDVNDNSYSYEAIMGEDTLTLYFSHPGYLDVPVGSWCDFYGKRYSLKRDSNFKKHGERNFEYTLILETSKADAMLWKVRNTVDNRIKFSYTAKPQEHLRMLVENLNRRGLGWKVGNYVEGTEKVINYSHTYILDALNQLAEAYETEWQITEADNVKTIHLRKVEYNKDNALKLSYGKGHGFKVGIGRESGEIPPEIILVETTDRNIDYSTYKSKNLLLPKSKTLVYEGHAYKTDADGSCVMRADKPLTTGREDSLDCTEIYPSRVGTVSSIIEVNPENNFYDFVDKDIPETLNFEECLIAGETMTVIFQTGMLVGKELEVKYIHEPIEEKGKEKPGRRFEIKPQEIDGITMPDGKAWTPKIGDTYAVFGIQLPESYICDNTTQTGASWEVFKEAAKYLFEHEDKKFIFTGTLDGIWAKKRWLKIGGKIILGGYVDFYDTQFHPEGSLIRMIGIKRYVNNPYSPEIELSNEPVGTTVSSELDKIETNEVTVDNNHKDALRFTKRRFRDAKETMAMLENALLNFSGSINPIAIQTMQLLVGDESLQFRFVNSKTSPSQISHNITYNPSTKILNAPSGILQHMTLGIKTVSSEHKASEYKYWDMASYDSPSLIEPEKKFYLYAKCGKDNPSGTFLLSETAIKIEQISGYYHLLTGILNSEYEGERSFVELYGFTEILPGRVTTERIISPDGDTYFDLVKGEIGGKIKFASGSSGLKNLDEWTEVSKDISDANDSANKANEAVSDLDEYIDGAFADGIISEAEAKSIEKYINVVKSAKLDVEATYNKLYINEYLTGITKTNLLNAKVTFLGAVDNLLLSINNAIADKKTTPEEKQDVDTKYAAFNTAYSSMSLAIESANKAIQDMLKGYSDAALKAAQDAAQAAKDASNSAGEANKAITELDKYVDGAFADGIIEESEAKAIEKYINTVNATKVAVEATYAKLYANTYLSGIPKTDLLNAKVTLFGTISDLISSINIAISDSRTTAVEKKDVDDKFALFNSAYASFNTMVEAANEAIQNTLKGYSDEALRKANEAVGNLKEYVEDSFADGIITKAEAMAIEKYLNTVRNTKATVEATYNKLYSNSYLEGEAKTNLLNAKISMSGAIENLIAAINVAIADGQTTVPEKQNVDDKFALFNSALANFYAAIEGANKAIQDKLKGYSDDISLTAKDNIAKGLGYDNYAALEKAALEGSTIINGGKINTELIEAAAIITSQILADAINGNGLSIGGDKFVVSIDENKKASVSVKGHIEAESGTFKGRVEANEGVFYGSLATPPKKIEDNTSSVTLSFENGFNYAGTVSQLNKGKIIYLPTDKKYNGVHCSILNYGGTSNGYFQIQTVNSYPLLYCGRDLNRNIVNHIKLYGTSEVRLKAIESSGSIRWFIENILDFSFDYINSCATNGIPNQLAKCLGSYWMDSQQSLRTMSCSDGNNVRLSSYDNCMWSFVFSKSRPANRGYSVIPRLESKSLPVRVLEKGNAGFKIQLYFEYVMGIEGVASIYVDGGGWGFDLFEFDV